MNDNKTSLCVTTKTISKQMYSLDHKNKKITFHKINQEKNISIKLLFH